MVDVDYWQLCDHYSVTRGSLLFLGVNPSAYEGLSENVIQGKVPGYLAVKTAITAAISSGYISTVNTVIALDNFGEEWIDPSRTEISADELDQFFQKRGHEYNYFSGRVTYQAESPNVSNIFFSKKLHAANKAWAAVTKDWKLLAGKSPKRALEEWLIEHAQELDLVNKDGKPNRTGIEEISKVANWKPEGGATPTPSLSALASASGSVRRFSASEPVKRGFGRGAGDHREPAMEEWPADLDDDIPF